MLYTQQQDYSIVKQTSKKYRSALKRLKERSSICHASAPILVTEGIKHDDHVPLYSIPSDWE